MEISDIYLAIAHGNIVFLENAIENGFDIKQPTPPGKITFLCRAMICDKENVFKFLLEKGVDPTQRMGTSGNTAFHFMASIGKVGLVKKYAKLISVNVLDIRNQFGEKPLDLAPKDLNSPASPSSSESEVTLSELRYAVIGYFQEKIKKLEKPATQKKITKFFALYEACLSDRDSKGAMRLLDAQFIDYIGINTTNAAGKTLLMLAASAGDVPVIEKLLNYSDINVNQADKNGDTALHFAIYSFIYGNNSPFLALLLLKKGALFKVLNKRSETPYASFINYVIATDFNSKDTQNLFKMFIDCGADINESLNKNGDTWLHIVASKEYNASCIQMLIDWGAKADITNGEKKTPLDRILDLVVHFPDRGYWQNVTCLLKVTPAITQVQFFKIIGILASESEEALPTQEWLALCMAKGADLKTPIDGLTAVEYAACLGAEEVIYWLNASYPVKTAPIAAENMQQAQEILSEMLPALLEWESSKEKLAQRLIEELRKAAQLLQAPITLQTPIKAFNTTLGDMAKNIGCEAHIQMLLTRAFPPKPSEASSPLLRLRAIQDQQAQQEQQAQKEQGLQQQSQQKQVLRPS